RQGSIARYFTSSSSSPMPSAARAAARLGCGAMACSSNSATRKTASHEHHPTMTREELIARLRAWHPGRRGFGGTSDPLEAAEVRAATRGDHDLNPGETPPSAALRPAAVL